MAFWRNSVNRVVGSQLLLQVLTLLLIFGYFLDFFEYFLSFGIFVTFYVGGKKCGFSVSFRSGFFYNSIFFAEISDRQLIFAAKAWEQRICFQCISVLFFLISGACCCSLSFEDSIVSLLFLSTCCLDCLSFSNRFSVDSKSTIY